MGNVNLNVWIPCIMYFVELRVSSMQAQNYIPYLQAMLAIGEE